jgi:predicted nucleotidyltransferase
MPILGITVPNMGIKQPTVPSPSRAAVRERTPSANKSTSLADALFTQTQQRVLGLLFGQPQRGFTVSELIASTGAGSGAAQRELAKLANSGLLTVQRIGNQKHYRANPAAPIHDELVGIVQKTVGLAEPLREALVPLAGQIAAAFLYGSIAKGSDTASSDIDVMVVSDTLGYADVIGALHPYYERLGREINPTVYSRAELGKRIKAGNAFVTRVLEQPKIWLIGDKDVLTA